VEAASPRRSQERLFSNVFIINLLQPNRPASLQADAPNANTSIGYLASFPRWGKNPTSRIADTFSRLPLNKIG
jgi:hypothetical protein